MFDVSLCLSLHPHAQSIVESNLRDLEDSKSQVHPTNEQSGVWCSGCGLLVVTITVLYAIALTYVLHRVSTEGEREAWMW